MKKLFKGISKLFRNVLNLFANLVNLGRQPVKLFRIACYSDRYYIEVLETIKLKNAKIKQQWLPAYRSVEGSNSQELEPGFKDLGPAYERVCEIMDNTEGPTDYTINTGTYTKEDKEEKTKIMSLNEYLTRHPEKLSDFRGFGVESEISFQYSVKLTQKPHNEYRIKKAGENYVLQVKDNFDIWRDCAEDGKHIKYNALGAQAPPLPAFSTFGEAEKQMRTFFEPSVEFHPLNDLDYYRKAMQGHESKEES